MLTGAISVGPGGRLYFGGFGDIGSITMSGKQLEFPAANGGSAAMTEGRDGSVWTATGRFDAPTQAHLEQITAAGTVRDDGQLPIHAYDAAGISEARDGAVWIATESAILRLTPPASR